MNWKFWKKEEQRSYNPFDMALMLPALRNTEHPAMALSAVYRCVELISDNLGILPIEVKAKNGKHKEVIEDHPITFLFENELMTKYNFIKLMVQSVLLKGNAFAYIERGKDGRPTHLRFLQSGDVTINYYKDRKLLFYTSPLVAGGKRIEPINMLHLKKNTFDGVNGVSVLTFASRTLSTANHTENSANNFFQNGCNINGCLSAKNQISVEQIEQIKKAWDTTYRNGNGIAVIPNNLEFQQIQLSATDSQMLESRQFNVVDIARFFGVSPILLGDASAGNYGSIEATQAHLLMNTLQPYITMFESEFNAKLLLPSERMVMSINMDETTLLKTDKSATANYFTTLLNAGVLCINEVRKELGYSEIENGDKHIIAYTDIKQNTINKEEEE